MPPPPTWLRRIDPVVSGRLCLLVMAKTLDHRRSEKVRVLGSRPWAWGGVAVALDFDARRCFISFVRVCLNQDRDLPAAFNSCSLDVLVDSLVGFLDCLESVLGFDDAEELLDQNPMPHPESHSEFPIDNFVRKFAADTILPY